MKVYVVVWRLLGGREVCTGPPYLTGATAERRLTRERREYPPGDFRVERVSVFTRGVFGPTLLLAFYLLLVVAVVVITVALLVKFT